MLKRMKLAIVGVGKLGLALLEGVIRQEVLAPQEIGIMGRTQSKVQAIAERTGTQALPPGDLQGAERVLICLKPQMFQDAAAWLAQPDTGYISTMAGVKLSTLSRHLHTERVVRAMPNLAATLGLSQTAIASPQQAESGGDVSMARQLFAAVGQTYDLPESLFDVFTGMSASGPGYAAIIAESLADGAVRMGMPRALAQELAARVLLSSGQLLLQREHPGLLKDEVSSPGGTTIAGLEVLETSGIRGIMMSTVVAATQRSQELGRLQE